MRPTSLLTLALLLLPTAARPEPASAPARGAPARSARPPVQLGLRAAIERALRVDPQLAAALLARERARLAVLRAQLDRVSAKADASIGEQWRAWKSFGEGGSSDHQASGTSSLSASLLVPIFSGFRVTATVRRAQHLDAAAAASQRATARSLALDVLRAYWAVRRAELQAAVSEQAIARFRDGVRVVRSRVDSGLAPPVDLNRMETRKLREEARLASLKGSAAEGRAQLAVALGLGGAELSLTEGADVPPLPPATAAEADRLLAAARGGRAELQAARRQTLAAVEAVRVAFSGYYPQLSGSLQLQWGNGSYYSVLGGAGFMTPSSSANPFASTTLSFLVGATLSINLFDTLNTRTAVRDARLVVAREREEERRLGRLVELDVRTALARLQRLYAARAPLLETRGQARDSLAIIERRYRNGESTILDYLDAQLELLSSELDLADAAASIALGWGELAAATGRLPGAGGRR